MAPDSKKDSQVSADIDCARIMGLDDNRVFRRARTAKMLEDAIITRTNLSPVVRTDLDRDVVQVLLSEQDALHFASFLFMCKEDKNNG